mmetsp:Transcript_115450/g.326305  ORF Transcript_115450/g.326305 Transcript_115450/m.326305 type:complete len:201 (+) Transcript_115450:1350-1952(+)
MQAFPADVGLDVKVGVHLEGLRCLKPWRELLGTKRWGCHRGPGLWRLYGCLRYNAQRRCQRSLQRRWPPRGQEGEKADRLQRPHVLHGRCATGQHGLSRRQGPPGWGYVLGCCRRRRRHSRAANGDTDSACRRLRPATGPTLGDEAARDWHLRGPLWTACGWRASHNDRRSHLRHHARWYFAATGVHARCGARYATLDEA